jgi:cytochrome c oxidase subunit 1/cytochrome c oxidase subunit I+III
MLSGFSNYLWPLMLGSRDMAFPRLNALSYWLFVFAGIFLYVSFPIGQAPNGGWFAYVPNTSRPYDPGINMDVFALGLIFLGISTVVGSVNFIVTLARCRAPGMSLNRLPIIVWGTLTASVANLFAIPAVSLACAMLWLDRRYDTHFFDVAGGGQPLLWQHLFWIFGHPWVYALVLPAMGIVSDALPVFCRRPLVGYTLVAISTVATMALGFGVGPSAVHHVLPVLRRLRLAFRHWRGVRLHDRIGRFRLAAHRHLLRRRAPALRPARHQRLPGHRRHPLLVPQDERPDDERASWTLDVLADVRRVQPRLLPHAHHRTNGHAAPHLHLSR